jgi:hypothetical protein
MRWELERRRKKEKKGKNDPSHSSEYSTAE